MASDEIPDPSQLSLEGSFADQVQHVLENVRLARYEVENLRLLFEDLEQTLRTFWPGCSVLPFGSIVTGLGIKSSDADCYIHLPEEYQRPGDKYVTTAKAVLMRHQKRFRELFAITTAKVPIVKFFHVPTQRHCDINFKSFAGVRNSGLIAKLMHMDSRVLPLAVMVKYWSKVHKLTGTNLVPNYALTMLVIFYLQQIFVLPPVKCLQRSQECYLVDHWDTSFNEDYKYVSGNKKPLYEILGGFFEFYSNFNFESNVISIFMGCAYSTELFTRVDSVPEDFWRYKQNLQNYICKPLMGNTPMCVQDPFDHSRNTAVAVHQKLAASFLSYIKYAAHIYKDSPPEHFLTGILNVKLAPVAKKSRVRRRPPKKIISNRMNGVVKQTVNNDHRNNVTLHNAFNELHRLIKKRKGN